MQAPKRIAVVGATGRVGRHVVDVLTERGHEVAPIARSMGVDVVTGEALAEALIGTEAIIDVATWPTPDEDAATTFFTTAAHNLHELGEGAGIQRMIVVSIIGIDKFTGGYQAAKLAHEKAAEAGPIPARIVRAAQFHEFVAQLVEWGTQGDVCYLPKMRTQLVAARTVAELLVDLATDPAGAEGPALAIAGPRVENLLDMAELLVDRRGDGLTIEADTDTTDPAHALYQAGALLPGPDAILGGPTFEAWLDASMKRSRRWASAPAYSTSTSP